MSFIRINLLAALCLALLVTSCKQEEENLAQPDKQPEDKVAALVALGQKPNYTEAEAQAFEAGYKALSYEELIRYREVEIAQLLKKYGDTKQTRELMDQNLAEWKEYNQKSIEQYGVASNQVSALQVDALLTTIEQEQAVARSSARLQANCPVVSRNKTYRQGSRGTFAISGIGEVDLGNKNDCDCELVFGASSFHSALQPMIASATRLLNSFGGSVSGRQLTSGNNVIMGKTRVTIYYPSTLFFGCSSLDGQYTLGQF